MVTTPWLRSSLPLAACVLLASTVAWVRVPLLPEIGEDLSLSATTLGWVVAAFGLGRLTMDLPAGRLADRVPPLKLLALASLVMSLASLALALAVSAAMAVAAGLLLGAGSATTNTTGMTTMAGSAPEDRRGSAMALYSGALLVGQATGPALAGLLASVTSWRGASAAGAVLALVVVGFAVVAGLRGAGDRIGAGRQRRPVPRGPVLTPVQHLVLFSVGFSVFFTVGSVAQMLIPLIGADQLHLGTAAIGLAIGAGGVARFIGAILTGIVSDRLSRRWALFPCLVLQAAGVALLARADVVEWWLVAVLAMSLGSSGHAVGATMLGDRTKPEELGRALGRYRFAGDIGLVVGPVLVAAVYQHAGRDIAVASVCAVLVLGIAAAATLLPETRSKATREHDARTS